MKCHTIAPNIPKPNMGYVVHHIHPLALGMGHGVQVWIPDPQTMPGHDIMDSIDPEDLRT